MKRLYLPSWCAADPGDEILIFDPTYANYMGFAAIAGVTLVPVAGNFDDNFALPDVTTIVSRLLLTPRQFCCVALIIQREGSIRARSYQHSWTYVDREIYSLSSMRPTENLSTMELRHFQFSI